MTRMKDKMVGKHEYRDYDTALNVIESVITERQDFAENTVASENMKDTEDYEKAIKELDALNLVRAIILGWSVASLRGTIRNMYDNFEFVEVEDTEWNIDDQEIN